MRKQSRSGHGRGTPSSATQLIRFSPTRPDSIPTSVLHRSDIDYHSIQLHLAIQDHEMHSVRVVLENIIALNPDFSQLNLRFTSERELLCRIANQHISLFGSSINRRLAGRDRETGAVGWLLYQFVLWCIKENQRTSRTGAAREKSASEPSTASNSGLGSLEDPNTGVDIPFEEDERDESQESDREEAGEKTMSENDDYGEPFQSENEVADSDAGNDDREEAAGFELDTQTSQHMIDYSDLEREVEDYEANIEYQMILRYGSPQVQEQFLRDRGNSNTGPMIPNTRSHADDQASPVELKTLQPIRYSTILFATYFLLSFIAVTFLCFVQYFHEKQGTSCLWDSIVLNQRQTIAMATTQAASSETRTFLTLTKATATIMPKPDL